MKKVIIIVCALMFAQLGKAQDSNPLLSVPYIEVTGESEMEIVPDEIYLQFTLEERQEGRDKTDLSKIEKQLKRELSAEDFDLDDLTVADANVDYVTIKRKKEDALSSKRYLIKLRDAEELQVVVDVLNDLDATDASILKMDHSNIEALKREAKINAVKNAKEKASYMLEAIDESIGDVLFMQEQQTYTQPYYTAKRVMVNSAMEGDYASEQVLDFQKIKLSYKVFARFAIKQ